MLNTTFLVHDSSRYRRIICTDLLFSYSVLVGEHSLLYSPATHLASPRLSATHLELTYRTHRLRSLSAWWEIQQFQGSGRGYDVTSYYNYGCFICICSSHAESNVRSIKTSIFLRTRNNISTHPEDYISTLDTL